MMRTTRRSAAPPRTVRSTGLLVSALAGLVLGMAPAYAAPGAPEPVPSDSRATFVEQNLTTCAQVGFPNDVQISGENNENSGDAYVKATGTGSNPTKVQVEITPAGKLAGVVVDAVVVKGGPASNVYKAPYLPPQLAAPQNYIAPRNSGGNVADISHYFVCYHFEQMPRGVEGELLVLKRVVYPQGRPVEPLPTSYTVVVTCTGPDGGSATETLTFSGGGGIGTTADGRHILRNIPSGSTCTVVEQGTDSFPEGATVTYFPAAAPDPGISTDRVNNVIITNDFSDVEVVKTRFKITKNVVPPAFGRVPSSFTVDYSCQDGAAGEVELSAGETVTVDDVAVGTYCNVSEAASELPRGWTVSYAVGGVASAEDPVFQVVDGRTVSVVVTNQGTGMSPDDIPGKDKDKD
ncbi:hypothetical protein H9Y04_39705 [Streptomyces sp. TRM66268-LWL]|uniref:DUF5979 domain-containing protein n=1 Tax=Streptomyces polyasparticus TaxID=2767826 RepID=A0ABR7ST47_9ACTN|nr:DUF5979 domain-containing protein [Streptomyces polyasparticus]MBC9718670.1 hypothetical protein [Streptomyces polyasparticus]